jgi:ABC-type lipoprotein export system ATPase subunit
MIDVIGISKQYLSGRGHVQALKSISFGLGKGTNLALVGKSGSGKTTLMNCIGGIEKPDGGKVVIEGQEIQSLSERSLCLFQRHHIGFVFQHGNLLSFLTVAENIAFPMNLNSVDLRTRNRRVSELLDLIGLPEIGLAMPYELSGGELQRVAVARAISHNPSLLLADEPTANLDSATGIGIMQMMIALTRSQGCTLIMATHDLELIALADRSIRLRDGLILDDHIEQKELIDQC